MIKREEFAARRAKLMHQMGDNSVAIIPAGHELIRNGDVTYPFRQDSDFYYLTGFAEPEAVAVIIPNRKDGEYILFTRDKDPKMEIWTGYRAGTEGAISDHHADEAFSISSFSEKLIELIQGRDKIYYTLGTKPTFDKTLMQCVTNIRDQVRRGVQAPQDFVDLDSIVHEMRLIKSEAEVNLMRKAADISADAHIKAMQACRPELFEYQLDAVIMQTFIDNGALSTAYDSIVGSGENACVLHYTQKTAQCAAGDLVLIDAGCEYQYYAADITRTFPVDGRYTEPQRAVYEAVLAAQEAAIAATVPGCLWSELQDIMVRKISEGLIELGLLKGTLDDVINDKSYRQFYMHNGGHWLGIDVHDAGRYKLNGDWRALEAGMVLTVEPGIYIAPGNKNIDKKWWGIGVRIEDDVWVTEDGCEVLSAGVPKTIDAIEKIMADAA
jgi:Xaa-Pro aminopeptidase